MTRVPTIDRRHLPPCTPPPRPRIGVQDTHPVAQPRTRSSRTGSLARGDPLGSREARGRPNPHRGGPRDTAATGHRTRPSSPSRRSGPRRPATAASPRTQGRRGSGKRSSSRSRTTGSTLTRPPPGAPAWRRAHSRRPRPRGPVSKETDPLTPVPETSYPGPTPRGAFTFPHPVLLFQGRSDTESKGRENRYWASEE